MFERKERETDIRLAPICNQTRFAANQHTSRANVAVQDCVWHSETGKMIASLFQGAGCISQFLAAQNRGRTGGLKGHQFRNRLKEVVDSRDERIEALIQGAQAQEFL
jgi:hypothetical protein